MKQIFILIFLISSCTSNKKIVAELPIDSQTEIYDELESQDILINIDSLSTGSIKRIRIETPPDESIEEDPFEIESEIANVQTMFLTDFEKAFFELGKKAPIKERTFGYPLENMTKISSSYGMRKGKLHAGIDYPRPTGTNILAINDGLVVFSGIKKGYGNVVILRHEDDIFSVYAHASKILVKKGDLIKKSTNLALVGSTGRSSGPHLHFEIRHGNRPVNPLLFYKQKLMTASNR